MKKLIVLFTVILIVTFAGCQKRPSNQAEQPSMPSQDTSSRVTYETPSPPASQQDTLDKDNNPSKYENPVSDTEMDKQVEPDIERIEGAVIALTFDDGPGRYTEQILDLLEQHGGRATFCVIGQSIESRLDTVILAANMGNEVIGHTWNHRDLTQLNEQDIKAEIHNPSTAIESATGLSSRLYRPAFGRTNEKVERVSAELGYAIVNWTVDPRDWDNRDADVVYNSVMSGAKDGAIILLHDVHATTAEAMERVIPELIAEGYQLITLSELLLHLYGEIEPGKVYGTIYRVNEAG